MLNIDIYKKTIIIYIYCIFVKKINVKNLDILFLDYLFFLLLDNLSFGLPVNLILFFVNDKSKI